MTSPPELGTASFITFNNVCELPDLCSFESAIIQFGHADKARHIHLGRGLTIACAVTGRPKWIRMYCGYAAHVREANTGKSCFVCESGVERKGADARTPSSSSSSAQ
jgi:hypothetical protein